MNYYIPLHVHSMWSINDSIAKPHHIAKRCASINTSSCVISDHGSLSGSLRFIKACKAQKIKPILGIEFYIASQHASIKTQKNRKLQHLVILAKNLQGWYELVQLVCAANNPNNFYYKPRLSLEQIGELSPRNLIAIAGHLGSVLTSDVLAIENSSPNWHKDGEIKCKLLQSIFGKENFWLEVQRIDIDNNPKAKIISEIVRELSKKVGVACVATPDSHYCSREDAIDQRVIIANKLQTTLRGINSKLVNDEDVSLGQFFRSDNYHIPFYEEMIRVNTEEELANTLLIADQCESYDITSPPKLPQYPVPEGHNSLTYLRQLCRDGWRKLEPILEQTMSETGVSREKYGERFQEEFSTLERAGLADYFLIVKDLIDYAKSKNSLTGCGRGCLSPNTPIYLSNGNIKKISEINVGDNVITQYGQSNTVTNVFKYECNEELIKIRTYYGDQNGVVLTKDHKILAEKFVKKQYPPTWGNGSTLKLKTIEEPTGNLEWIESKNLSIGDWVFIPTPIIKQNNLEKIDLNKYADGSSLYCDEEFCYYQIKNPLTHNYKLHTKHSRYINIDKDFFRILGIFAGNGWLSKNIKSQIGLCTHSEKSNIIDFINSYFTKIGIHIVNRFSKTTKLVQFFIFSKFIKLLFQDLFNEYKSTSNTKHVPSIVFNSKPEYIESFLQGLYETDGYLQTKNSCRMRLTTTSHKMAYQVRFLNWILGKPANLRIDNRIDKREAFKNTKTSYYVNIPCGNKKTCFRKVKGGILVRILSIENIINKSNIVYDLEIENNHNYLTSSFLVHNSAAGSLILYLLGVTRVDPLRYNLLWSRFYNEGRNTKDNISLPDVDMDFERSFRPQILKHIRNTYGVDKVAQIITFGRMQGRSALKDVLRVYESCSFEEMNRITEFIPDESKIIDDLQEMRETSADGEASILEWSIENNPKELKQWVSIEGKNKDGSLRLAGDLAKRFEQAIRLEGTLRSSGKHAAGVVIGHTSLSNFCPLAYDKKAIDEDSQLIAAFEKDDLEKIGMLKLDALSISLLDKLHATQDLVNK